MDTALAKRYAQQFRCIARRSAQQPHHAQQHTAAKLHRTALSAKNQREQLSRRHPRQQRGCHRRH
jgi:hypothetical protein